jgi:3-oxoacid CoA-transferase subunit A
MTIMLAVSDYVIPNSIAELVKKETTNLTCISNNAGVDDFGLGLLLQKASNQKMISSYVGKMPNLNAKCYLENSKLILFPQGTLERCRAAQAGILLFSHQPVMELK